MEIIRIRRIRDYWSSGLFRIIGLPNLKSDIYRESGFRIFNWIQILVFEIAID